jgi:hypothetical protein
MGGLGFKIGTNKNKIKFEFRASNIWALNSNAMNNKI